MRCRLLWLMVLGAGWAGCGHTTANVPGQLDCEALCDTSLECNSKCSRTKCLSECSTANALLQPSTLDAMKACPKEGCVLAVDCDSSVRTSCTPVSTWSELAPAAQARCAACGAASCPDIGAYVLNCLSEAGVAHVKTCFAQATCATLNAAFGDCENEVLNHASMFCW